MNIPFANSVIDPMWIVFGYAIGVAAGFAPVSIGTETDGSIVYPATRAGLYAMKPSLGSVPLEGAMPVNANFDMHGGMAKSAQDLADLLGVMTSRTDLASDLPDSWAGLKVGYSDFELWRLTPNEVEEVEIFAKQSASGLGLIFPFSLMF
jgi:amidase